MSEPKIDEIDRQIIALLEMDAREPVASLARKVGRSRSAVVERIDRLLRLGVIEGFTLKRSRKVPAAPIRAYMILKLRGPICERVAPQLEKIPEVKRSQSISGELDMILYAETGTLEGLSEVRRRVEAIGGVAEVTTAPILVDRFDRS